jgi:hypothetical protein
MSPFGEFEPYRQSNQDVCFGATPPSVMSGHSAAWMTRWIFGPISGCPEGVRDGERRGTVPSQPANLVRSRLRLQEWQLQNTRHTLRPLVRSCSWRTLISLGPRFR